MVFKMDPGKLLHHARFIPLAIISFSLFPIFRIVTLRYIYDRFEQEYVPSENTNSTRPPLTEDTPLEGKNDSRSASDAKFEEYVQQHAAQFNMYFVIVHSMFLSIAMPLWGSLSDVIGRKIPIVVSTVGSMLHLIAALLVFQFEWPLWVILLGMALHCILGNQAYTISCSGNAFICDTVPSDKKTLEISLHALWLTLGNTIGSLIAGELITFVGYVASTGLILVFQPFLILYTVLVIPKFGSDASRNQTLSESEGTTPEQAAKKSTARKKLRLTIKRAKKVINPRDHGAEITVLLLIHVICTAGFSCDSFLFVYVQGCPFFWRSRMMGMFMAGSGLLVGLASPLATWLCDRFRVSQYWLMVVGVVSGMLRFALYGVSDGTPVLFVAAVAGALYYIPYQASLAMVSDLVPQESQGALVSVATTAQLTVSLTTTVLYNHVYSRYLLVNPGLVFFIGGGVYTLCVPLILIARWLAIRRQRQAASDEEAAEPATIGAGDDDPAVPQSPRSPLVETDSKAITHRLSVMSV